MMNIRTTSLDDLNTQKTRFSLIVLWIPEVYQHQDTYYNQENDLYSVYGYGFGSSEPGSDVENDAVSDS